MKMCDLTDAVDPVDAGGAGDIELFIGLADIQVIFQITAQGGNQLGFIFLIIPEQILQPSDAENIFILICLCIGQEKREYIVIELIDLAAPVFYSILCHGYCLGNIKPDILKILEYGAASGYEALFRR